MASISMSITGEFFTTTARNLVLEDNATGAINIIHDGLIGITYDQVYMILKGDYKIIGDSRDDSIAMVPDEDSADYKQQLLEKFSGVVRVKGDHFVKPYAYVKTWGPLDMRWARDHGACQYLNLGTRDDRTLLSQTRSLYYADDRHNDMVEDHDINVRGLRTSLGLGHVLFKSCTTPPPWVDPAKTLKKGVSKYFEHCKYKLELRGWEATGAGWDAKNRVQKAVKDPETVESVMKEIDQGPVIEPLDEHDIDEIIFLKSLAYKRELILKQAEGGIFHEVEFEGKTIRIPEAPFAHWAAGTRKTDVYMDLLPEWKTICHSGMRLQMDDPYHSDWMLAAGIELFTDPNYRDVNESVWPLMDEINKKFLTLAGNAWLCGGDYAYGDIVLAKTNEKVPEGSIAIAPNASPSYLLAALSASVFIVGAGGTMCHLATVGREKGSNILLVPDVMNKLKVGMKVTIDEDAKVEIHEKRI